MKALPTHLAVTLRLQFRNPMALAYSYAFPVIFTLAFWALYRYEQVPLARHMGELLTVTALGGACFGLPTAMVSERERGVWRRYRIAPVATASLVGSTVAARYLLLLTAGVLQLALAMAIGMPLPAHPFDLWVAFTFVCFAFLGLGLVIAMLADTVPAVQALGQCIFLPMLIIGGVAVRLAALPVWAQHLSAFFPGRYAVDAIQSTVTGPGLGAGAFSLLALLLTGLAGVLAGAKMFRWDSQRRRVAGAERAWVAVALAAWIAVGAMAEARGLAVVTGRAAEVRTADSGLPIPGVRPRPPAAAPAAAVDSTAIEPAPPEPAPLDSAPTPPPDEPPASADSPAPPGAATPSPPRPPLPRPLRRATGWRAVTMLDIQRDLIFSNLPPDDGVVAPIARGEPAPYPEIECVAVSLPEWGPAQVIDPVQRVRNLLYVAAVPDLYQIEELERNVPIVVFDRIQQEIPRDQLIQILYWIALHPDEGDVSASARLPDVCLELGQPGDIQEMRNRAAIYAVKLLGRVLGRIEG